MITEIDKLETLQQCAIQNVSAFVKKPLQELKSYDCSLDGKHWSTFNATSRGKAKSMFYRECDFDLDYKMIKCRTNGYPYTSDEFRRNAKYRDIEFAYCGMAVQVQDWNGVIVGHNDSANLNVLFLDGANKGQVLNCHPNWKIKYFNKSGEVVKAF
jgi:hypothetical protein